jgi:hypothetical protein
LSWSKKFSQPIRLKDGRELRTLSEARALIVRMEGRIEGMPVYEYAIELLLKAAETGKRADIQEAENQLGRAVFVDGLKARA